MIISVHIRKNAGHSFRTALKAHYGDRLYFDYGDEIGSTSLRSKLIRLKRKFFIYKNRRHFLDHYDVVHGHFYADKYKGFAKDLQYATILRDPVDRVLSNYYYIKRNEQRGHPNTRMVHEKDMSLEDYIRHPEARNVQSRFLRGVGLSNFTFVGICEDYANSIRLFNAIFGASLQDDGVKNVNPEKTGPRYDVDPHVADLIRECNPEDCQLYEEGVAMYRASLERYCPAPELPE